MPDSRSPLFYFFATSCIPLRHAAFFIRLNWSIPKRLAVFSFTPVSSRATHVAISHPSSPSSPSPPFFSAVLSTNPYLPLPFYITTHLPTPFTVPSTLAGLPLSKPFLQPPLAPLPPGRGPNDALLFQGKISGWARVCSIEGKMHDDGGAGALGDGKDFTRGEEVCRTGFVINHCRLIFGKTELLLVE